MKYLPNIAGVLLGILFLMSSVVVLFNLIPPEKMPKPPTPEAETFMTLFMTTGYMKFVKVVELIGAILVAIPKTRNYGLLFLGPVLVNILAYHIFISKGAGLFDPMLIVICLLSAYLLWAGRAGFAALRN